jgi:UDP-N-acetylglucosamine--N-acetylmuramyl-(pentapeptide) pyrophosphoryl-undecaprenol N-acetylglucosamine transferase
MKILFTGGGTGGHFYPIIAVAEEMHTLVKENHLVDVELFYMSHSPYNEGLLFEHNIIFKKNIAGKVRVTQSLFSLMNIIDVFKMGWGVCTSLWEIFKIYPDVIFGKGGYASFPALLAGRILRIPVVIHESDSVPGRVNAWAGKFAERIAISYPESAQFFPKGKTAYTGNPIRKDIMHPLSVGAHEYLNLDTTLPTLLVIGGSQGAQIINDTIIDALPHLVEKYQIIHQTGKNNIVSVTETARLVLGGNAHADRYKPFDYLNNLALRMSAGVADIVISRAGSSLFEIASWAVPAIVIPITKSNENHQRMNAYAYARTGAAVVIEEINLSGNILSAEIDRLIDNPDIRKKMSESAVLSQHPDAAKKIASEILNIALSHEK